MTTELETLLGEAAQEARFDTRPIQGMTATSLRDMYQRSEDHRERMGLAGAQAHFGNDHQAALESVLGTLLDDYIADDLIGNGFSHLVAGFSAVPVSDLARSSVTAAALLGPEEVERRLNKWARGDAISFRRCATLSGVALDGRLDIGGGMRLEGLPVVLTPLPLGAHAPGPQEVMLTIEGEGGPAFYNPAREPERECTWGGSPDPLIDALCGALSLALDTCVTRRLSWGECDEVQGFGLTMGLSWHTAPDSLSPRTASALSTDHIATVEALFAKLQANQSAGLAMALRRWMRSKAQIDVADQFIELRIALESLFLNDSIGESRFRVASRAAWYLGQSIEERTAHQKTIAAAYEVASRAVHTGAVKNPEDGRELLGAAQDLVRRAILKRLDEPHEPDWGRLVLGGDPRAASVPESPNAPDAR